MAKACFIRLQGGFRVEVDGRPVPPDAWRRRKGADLVKLLALAPRHRLHREQVMESLWPERESEPGTANLRKAIHYARRALGDVAAIRLEGDMLVLWPTGDLQVDIEVAEATAANALATGRDLEAAADLFTGELLPEDRYAPWAEAARERLLARH